MNTFNKSLVVTSLLLVSALAFAQEPVPATNPVKAELQKDNQEVRADKEKLENDKKAGVSKFIYASLAKNKMQRYEATDVL